MLKHLSTRHLAKPLVRSSPTKAMPTSDAGFSILEPLIAIIVVAILLVVSAPMIVLSVASQVKARQMELATQAARSYIDGLRAGSIDPPSTINTINTAVVNRTTPLADDFRYQTCAASEQQQPVTAPTDTACVRFPNPLPANFLPPTFAATDFDKTNTKLDQGVLIDGNGDGNYRGVLDFRIQAIRTMIPRETAGTIPQATDVRAAGYSVIVRVYQGNATIGQALGTTEMGSAFTATTRTGRASRNNPLVIIRTDIVGSDANGDTYNDTVAPKIFQP